MKKLALSLLLPIAGMASHSLDMGAFYTQHKEKGYKYDFSGWSLSYEIGNSKGLKASGKVYMSNDSDLLFVQVKNEILFYIPAGQFEIFPFLGGHTTHHNVYKKDHAIGVLQRTYIPLGLGIRANHGDFSWYARGAHMHPVQHTYVYDEGAEDFWGKKFYLPSNYFLEGQAAFKCTDRIKAVLMGSWQQDYQQRLSTWIAEATITVTF